MRKETEYFENAEIFSFTKYGITFDEVFRVNFSSKRGMKKFENKCSPKIENVINSDEVDATSPRGRTGALQQLRYYVVFSL